MLSRPGSGPPDHGTAPQAVSSSAKFFVSLRWHDCWKYFITVCTFEDDVKEVIKESSAVFLPAENYSVAGVIVLWKSICVH